jgi:hypothetical protein
MIKDKKYCRICVSDEFIIYTKRQDGLFGKNVVVYGLPNRGVFEDFGQIPKGQIYRFQSTGMADIFFETANLVMDYQDGLRNCLAPIDYSKNPESCVDDVWVDRSPLIGPYQDRKIQGHIAQYDKNAELQRLCNMHGLVPLRPRPTHVVLDTMQTSKNGISYVYNLLIKTEDIKNRYNPTGLATVEITGFVSENDAEYYWQTSQLFKHIAETENSFSYDKYAKINQKRKDMFTTITSKLREN